jgi:ABC-2 type transport system permease protein
LIAVALCSLVCFIIAKSYVKLYSTITSVKKSNGYKIASAKNNSPFMAVVKKDFKRILSNAIYALNSYMSSIMYIFVAVGLSIMLKVLGVSVFLKDYALVLALPLTALILLMMSPTTALISVEGKSFSLLKTLPLSTDKILTAKLFVGSIVPAIFGTIGSLVIGILFNIGILQTILLTIATVVLTIGGSALGLILNVRFCNLEWTNINQPVKQGLPVLLMLVFSIVLAAVFAGIAYLGYAYEIFLLTFIFQVVVTFAFSLGMLLILYSVSAKRFSTL